jgi:hypothetical protein
VRVNQLLVELHGLVVLLQLGVRVCESEVSFVRERHQFGRVFRAHRADHFAVLVLLSQQLQI